MLQGESISEQTANVISKQSTSTSTTGEGDQVSAGTKRSSNDDGDDDSAVKRPYDGRGYHRGAYGGWTVVAERLVNLYTVFYNYLWLITYLLRYY